MFWEYHLSGSVEVDFSRLEEEDQGKGSNSTEKARKPGPVVVLGTEVGMGSQTLRQTCGACLEDAWVQHGTDPLYPWGAVLQGPLGRLLPSLPSPRQRLHSRGFSYQLMPVTAASLPLAQTP